MIAGNDWLFCALGHYWTMKSWTNRLSRKVIDLFAVDWFEPGLSIVRWFIQMMTVCHFSLAQK